MIFVYYSLFAVALIAALAGAYRSGRRGVAVCVALLYAATATLLWLMGFLALALALLAIAVWLAIAPPALQRAESRSRLRTQAIPILVAAALGFAAPFLWDAQIDESYMPPPVEGLSAARGGYGLQFAILGRGLLTTACVVAIGLLAFLLKRALHALPDLQGGAAADSARERDASSN